MEKYKFEGVFDNGNDDGYDAVVVGSGYGGSVAACRLAMAGFNVCLIEKGRRWEAQDFPTDSFEISSAVRVESSNLGLKFGPKDALFQVYQQDDSLAVMACGLGGGSLINAGVMLPATVRARRDPRWPKAWEKDWEKCQALAEDMMKIQSVPLQFQNAKIMEKVIDEDYKFTHNPFKLSLNFDNEQDLPDSRKSGETGSCVACGNCLSGCPYNAKNSTDRTYLPSAIQAGCTIKTECEVRYVVSNLSDDDNTCYNERRLKNRSQRRWLVYFSEIDHVASDIVILSAGVFGTAKILFHSQLRGLSVSQRLGFGLSCNGNNIAYVVDSSANLNASGLKEKHFSKIPFEQRPGPSISSSYSSSLGITIQSAVMPAAYPRFLLKGLTYQWHYDCWFLNDVIDRIKSFLGLKNSQEIVLNAMGYDDSSGKLTFNKHTNRILFQPPHDPLLPRKVEAFQKLAKKLGGILFMSRYRSTAVHLLGGCSTSSDVSSGVCNSDGQVFNNTSQTGVHPGLYVCDASIIPCSIGINPCLTIATAAEHVSKHLVEEANEYIGTSDGLNNSRRPGLILSDKMKSNDSELNVKETMTGQIGGMPCKVYLKMKFKTSQNFDLRKDCGESHPFLRGRVGGHVECNAIEMDRMYIIHGEVDLCRTDIRTPYTQYMHYHLLLAASSGSRYVLEGKKILNPYLLALYSWSESTTMNVSFQKIVDNIQGQDMVNLKGMLYISPIELLKSLWSLDGGSKKRFIFSFLQSLLRTYLLQKPRGRHIDLSCKELEGRPYPNSTVLEFVTGDGTKISCQHWERSQSSPVIEPRKICPVILINGYSTESYSLPTEPNDLVRTFLEKGHDVWLLRTRVHPSFSSNCFSIEDIGRYDIAAGIKKIVEFYGEPTKVHIVAHCVGGVALHIALMGGHVSAKKIASLSCTNSSMFFKLTTSSLVKMWLPLIPISMAILGKNKTLQLIQPSTASFRHRLLQSIARLIPRYERCSCDECEVFSGVFGNAFWHANISPAMHNWLNKINVPCLPMAGFPHLRKICQNGFIVDSKGQNKYLSHPERMTLPTLYISGGRTLLLTPETSFLANKYMKMHQPNYRHERVVIDGFGHSDLLIGEESSEKVFPHIMRHIKLAEKDMTIVSSRGNGYSNEVLAWSEFRYEKKGKSNDIWILTFITIVLLVVMIKFFSTP